MKKNNTEFLTFKKIILIITTTVFSFSSLTTAFFLLGMRAIPWFILAALFYFVPYTFIISDFTAVYKNEAGGVYSWLKDVFSEKVAFIAAFLWYCSYFIWMISLFMKIWIPLSFLIFGEDRTQSKSVLYGLQTSQWIGLFSILAVFFVMFLINRGFKRITSLMFISGFLMVGLVLISLLGNLYVGWSQPESYFTNFQASLQTTSFYQSSTNPILSQLPFFLFAITAFGGLDTVASLVDKTGKKKRVFPLAIIISCFLIIFCYFLGLIVWSGGTNLTQIRNNPNLNLGNLMYGMMGTLGSNLDQAKILSIFPDHFFSQLLLRFTALTMSITYLSLLTSLAYAPLKALMEGTPDYYWKAKLRKKNKFGIPATAVRLQSIGISLCIFCICFFNPLVNTLYNQLTYMTNISRSLPYLLVALAYPAFRKKIKSNSRTGFINSNFKSTLLSISVSLCIFAAILFQLYEPFKQKDYLECSSLLLGPCFFALIGLSIYIYYSKRKKVYPKNV